ncbi:AEC family transporter [Paenirhodobacter populi]|uniref:AEC family transporter n=1 Tax=Paenirhodobacter populi TaxID=2306993 RepID=A0A443KMW8_9RHOB|nr:AEC family transporter [Sinirhodobacter populi]RWR09379.1 AEC family transporter [Sinirhodobacter populi]RWR13012.1 AEC family transporter [Sinirhodobacter populi]RWR20780.1 AEC family transporter [Sinirhodobacter populi]RWR29757.1 AEC family transporter [Sinirhodobacter populi]RWR34140.1 AEC family transporter [Sinirhodobacter populi]
MSNLADVLLPVFLVMGFGYLAAWKGIFVEPAIGSLMKFAQTYAVPVLLAIQTARIDLRTGFHLAPLVAFYSGALLSYAIGVVLSRTWLKRSPVDAAAIGFCCLFSNSVLIGIPITERAYGAEGVMNTVPIIAVHSPLLFTIGILMMEAARARGAGLGQVALNAAKGVMRTPMVIGIVIGFAANIGMSLTGHDLPKPLWDALLMLGASGVPVALFGLGGVLHRYKPEGDGRAITMVVLCSLVVHPGIAYVLGRWVLDLDTGPLRAAVLTAAMAPGINAYLFADMYGAAKRVAASSVLISTIASLLTIWVWLSILP